MNRSYTDEGDENEEQEEVYKWDGKGEEADR